MIERVAGGVGGIVVGVEWLLHLGDGWADARTDYSQVSEVEAVDAGRGRFDHHLRLGRWARRERGTERFGRVREAALGMGIVGAPHDAVDTDLVPQRALGWSQKACADPEVALEVLARRQRHVLGDRTE